MTKHEIEPLVAVFRASLAARRKAAGWSQTELARRIERGPSYVCDLERGRRSPNLDTLQLLAGPFGIPPAELLRVPTALELESSLLPD